ncbi:hypothetical protein ACFL1H_06230 [Nanoarchaeota archaeon]
MKDKIMSLARAKGYVIPADVAKVIQKDQLVSSAYLSELSSSKKLKVSNIKVGNSPVYYLPENKHRLVELNNYLNAKDKDAYNLLSEKKMLRDNKLTPLLRVSLRQIKDFAIPLNVSVQGKSEIFWKWFLLSDEHAKEIIGKILDNGPKKEVQEEIKDKKVEEKRKRKY